LDLIVSVDALEHVPEPDRAFDEIDRCLRPGGVAILAPSWHVPWYHGPGYRFRSWREVAVRNWLHKAAAHVLARVSLLRRACIVAGRLRFVHQWWSDRVPLRWKRLRACYELGLKGYIADSDATAFLDSFAAIVYFRSRGYRQLRPEATLCASLFAGHIELIVQKPVVGDAASVGDGCWQHPPHRGAVTAT
jgi:SAM-dependent methyltransferase